MKNTKSNILFVSLLFSISANINAQSVSNAIDDDRQRGYYDRPYKRYEAETDKCTTNGTILAASFENINIQSEASNQVATQLIAKDSYIEWNNDEAADGMVIRFSIPDNATTTTDGTGTTAILALYVNDVFIENITLNSFWAWQYFSGSANVAYEKIISNPIYRMRFDETRVKLTEKIPAGAKFKLVKTADNDTAYTIDFVELEPVPVAITYESLTGDKVQYIGDGSDLQTFIDNNGGKTIYIPEGKYDVNERLYLNTSNTKLQGAGMWYTQINFTAPLTADTYSKRGIQGNNSYLTVDGLYLSTINNVRYYLRNGSYQVGKGLNGSFGIGSTVSNVWAEHFECGGWIEGSDGLTVQNCRFRNNYADGINLCNGSKNCIVEHCNFRNNGDDDMASWSRVNLCINNTFRYNTSQHCWRAAGIGFFWRETKQSSPLYSI